MRRGGALAVTLAALVVATGCPDAPYRCTKDEQCVRSKTQGFCEENARCSFPDGVCPSGRRYGPYGTDGACVIPRTCGGAGQPCCEIGRAHV